MNARFAITTLTLLISPWAAAQNVPPEPQEDPVQAAIREFNKRDNKEPNEVTVVLAPPIEDASPEPVAEKSAETPVLVTGKAPEGTELVESSEKPETDEETTEPAPSELLPEELEPKPRKGLVVRVENIQVGDGFVDPSKVKLIAPFPAKPLTAPPAGWHLKASASAPPFTREVELSPGKHIKLTIRPHLLVPDTDGTEVFVVSEPGFDPSLGYLQDATVGAILSKSIRQLDDDSKELGTVIDNLQQLLVSLPKPEPDPKPETSRKQ
jgi:hypothetical protein